MNWIDSPQSTAIARFGYNFHIKALDVEFISGETYRYFRVPEILFRQMKRAGSKGQFFMKYIYGRYHYTRLENRQREHAT